MVGPANAQRLSTTTGLASTQTNPSDAYGTMLRLVANPLGIAAALVLLLCSAAAATTGCLHCFSSHASTRLQVLAIRSSNLLCAIVWGVLCWEQLENFPDCALATFTCGLAASLHVVVICAQRGQRAAVLMPAHESSAFIEKRLHLLDLGDNVEAVNPLLSFQQDIESNTRDADTASQAPSIGNALSECLMFDNDNMPGVIVVPSGTAAVQDKLKVAKFYQTKLLYVSDDKAKDM